MEIKDLLDKLTDAPVEEKMLIYVAEQTATTCSACAANAGKVFRVSDPERPQLPLHPNCACHYEEAVQTSLGFLPLSLTLRQPDSFFSLPEWQESELCRKMQRWDSGGELLPEWKNAFHLWLNHEVEAWKRFHAWRIEKLAQAQVAPRQYVIPYRDKQYEMKGPDVAKQTVQEGKSILDLIGNNMRSAIDSVGVGVSTAYDASADILSRSAAGMKDSSIQIGKWSVRKTEEYGQHLWSATKWTGDRTLDVGQYLGRQLFGSPEEWWYVLYYSYTFQVTNNEKLNNEPLSLQQYNNRRTFVNDNKYGHSNSAAYGQSRTGLIGTPLVTGIGIVYELLTATHLVAGHTPGGDDKGDADWLDGQNFINWLYDTPGDLLANTIGQGVGILHNLSNGLWLIEDMNRINLLIPGPDYSRQKNFKKYAKPGMSYPE